MCTFCGMRTFPYDSIGLAMLTFNLQLYFLFELLPLLLDSILSVARFAIKLCSS
jgi:hypothetical protein